MSIRQELSRVKNAFGKVKNDMVFLSNQISENYEKFLTEHNKLANEVSKIHDELIVHINELKQNHLHPDSTVSDQEMSDVKQEIKELKAEVSKTHSEHIKLSKLIEDVKKEKKDIKGLKEKLHSSELEIHLLKERLLEKDVEIKQLKEISRKMFHIIDELSNVELQILNKTNK